MAEFISKHKHINFPNLSQLMLTPWPIYTMPKKFLNYGIFTLKMYQMFYIHTMPEKFRQCNNHWSVWIKESFWKTWFCDELIDKCDQ